MGFDWNNPYYLLHRAATFDGRYGIDKATYKMFRTNLAQFLEFRAKNLSIFDGEVVSTDMLGERVRYKLTG